MLGFHWHCRCTHRQQNFNMETFSGNVYFVTVAFYYVLAKQPLYFQLLFRRCFSDNLQYRISF